MRNPLIPCASCHRHVKVGADRCPFCDAAFAAPMPAAPPDTRGWKRAAIFTVGAALTLGGCSSTVVGSDASPQDGATADRAATDVSVDTASDAPSDGTEDRPDNGGVAPPYGIAPPDAGPPDDGAIKAEYGAPPPPRDASVDAPDDNGSFKADYGAPPPRDGG